MTHLSDTDAPARPAASGTLLLRAILAACFAVGALLFVVGLPRDSGFAFESPAATVAQAAMAGSEQVPASGHAASAGVAEVDCWADEPSSADPLSHVPPRLSAAGFRPHARALVPAWDSVPPDRPPRSA